MNKSDSTETATFAGGCFWGIGEFFRTVPGVKSTAAGFMGGRKTNPTYEEVCYEDTGHAEVVQIEFDPRKVSYEKLVELFWEIHDPTTLNRQGPDAGEQYRSAIFFHSPEQKKIAEKSKQELEASKKFSRPLVTRIEPAQKFFKAEEYHQKYLLKRGDKACH
ncbi:MAG: peptide-methionine (S)-S-oxide reductase MsrA [Candidatus Diapherotrites archaeon]|nr:peptide-methionine (S)-S-oxide reductase MsrA [Candidatus Diapherotrites archaeon]